MLSTILEEAVHVTDDHLGMIYLIDGDFLKLRTVWPSRETDRIRGPYDRIPLNRAQRRHAYGAGTAGAIDRRCERN